MKLVLAHPRDRCVEDKVDICMALLRATERRVWCRPMCLMRSLRLKGSSRDVWICRRRWLIYRGNWPQMQTGRITSALLDVTLRALAASILPTRGDRVVS